MTKSILVLVITFITLIACEKENYAIEKSLASKARSSNGINLNLLKEDKSTVNLIATSFSIQVLSENNFTVVINPGTMSSQSFNCAELTAIEEDNELRITKNPCLNQVIYANKSHLQVILDQNGQLLLSINNGSITTTATSLIGDETEGL